MSHPQDISSNSVGVYNAWIDQCELWTTEISVDDMLELWASFKLQQASVTLLLHGCFIFGYSSLATVMWQIFLTKIYSVLLTSLKTEITVMLFK